MVEGLVKTLKRLQELDITLEILAETGIGKVVNSFRKHDDVGEVAKTLVQRWKKLVPSPSITQNHPPSPKEPSKTEIQQTDREEKNRASQNTTCSERKSKNESSGSEHKHPKSAEGKIKVKPITNKLKNCMNDQKDGTKKDSNVGLISQVSITDRKSFQLKEKLNSDLLAERKNEGKRKVSDVTNKHGPKMSTKVKSSSLKERDLSEEKSGKDKRKEKSVDIRKDLESDDFEMPSMSFEEYLSYDLEAPKRKKRSCESKNPKRIKLDQKQDVKMTNPSMKSGRPITEALTTEVSKRCVMDLLNVPLPAISPECDDPSQYQYFTEKKVEEKAVEVCEEAAVFTGQRLNKKMQVYSGAKVVFLPTMMTLYQQCIRTLQNNIDSLYEIGGVPFEILEPVLERCTPEQLLRIEDCNPVYMGVTDHLWEKHCHRDFRNAQLEEYESWRELYLRIFEERERKLQELTKSIVSAHSGKPKGRQVKMAFINSAAKPPRNVRIQQELHGTAGPGLLHAADKLSGRIMENRGKPSFTEPPKPFNSGSGASQPQDSRKIRRVAPMMAKSLKAFKKQFARR
ncbi:elongin A, like [Neoarius graeffei]|uniref:elongin A, like n=1 Tax=Neoarius graeffei TaxID=443677 RepID=UPI00298D5BF3|nr:elongin A, like [Neoarius graeffei]